MPSDQQSRGSEFQSRADRIRAFQVELAELERAGIIQLEEVQRGAVAGYHADLLARLAREHDTDTTDSLRQLSLGLRLATLLGTLAFTAAVVLFVLRFWGALPTAAQLGLALAAPLVPLVVAELAARREKTLYVAALFAVVAAAGFALNLVVLTEVLNLPAAPHPLLLWGGFALLLAYRYANRVLLLAGLLTTGWWVAASLYALSGGWYLDFPRLPETALVPGVLLLLLPGVLHHARHRGFNELYRIVGLVLVGLVAAMIALDGQRSILPFGERGAEIAYTLSGLTVGIGAIVVGVQRSWLGTARAGTGVAILLMVVKAVDWWWELIPHWLFFLVLGGLALLAISGLKRLRALALEGVE